MEGSHFVRMDSTKIGGLLPASNLKIPKVQQSPVDVDVIHFFDFFLDVNVGFLSIETSSWKFGGEILN